MEIIKDDKHYLDVKIDNENQVINITGNKEGLSYLGKVCLGLSQKESEHWHFSYAFNTLTKNSMELIVHKMTNRKT